MGVSWKQNFLKDKNLSYFIIFIGERNGGDSSLQDHKVDMDEREPSVDGQDTNGNGQKPNEADAGKLKTFLLSQ
jgi:hypothetical protein